MPIPTPRKGEKQQDFVSRCMGDKVMVKDFGDQSQRAAVCYREYRKYHGSHSSSQDALAELQHTLRLTRGDLRHE